MGTRAGWSGRVYEDFEVGDVYRHPLGRTVIAADNIWFTLLTQNSNAIHFDAGVRRETRSSASRSSTPPSRWRS